MKCRKFLFASLIVALAPLIGGFPMPLVINAQAQPQAETDSARPLSPPAAEVVKMVLSGAPEYAVRAFIENSSSTFDLTPESTDYLQSIGIPATITDAMSSHDANLNENPDAAPPA